MGVPTPAQTCRKSVSRARNPAAPVAVLLQVLSLDVLHGEPGQAVFRRAAVVEARDVWVLEGGQDAPLGQEEPDDELRVHPAADDLQGDPLLEAVARWIAR